MSKVSRIWSVQHTVAPWGTHCPLFRRVGQRQETIALILNQTEGDINRRIAIGVRGAEQAQNLLKRSMSMIHEWINRYYFLSLVISVCTDTPQLCIGPTHKAWWSLLLLLEGIDCRGEVFRQLTARAWHIQWLLWLPPRILYNSMGGRLLLLFASQLSLPRAMFDV